MSSKIRNMEQAAKIERGKQATCQSQASKLPMLSKQAAKV